MMMMMIMMGEASADDVKGEVAVASVTSRQRARWQAGEASLMTLTTTTTTRVTGA